MGANVDRVVSQAFTLGGALAGIAGFVLVEYYGVANFFMGFLIGFKALTAAIVGGIGSIRGAVLGGALIALLETFWSGYLGGTYREVAVFTVLALVLAYRPSGLLGRDPDVSSTRTRDRTRLAA
jgi:branched-chain amino acid transport system permease protein